MKLKKTTFYLILFSLFFIAVGLLTKSYLAYKDQKYCLDAIGKSMCEQQGHDFKFNTFKYDKNGTYFVECTKWSIQFSTFEVQRERVEGCLR